MEPLKEDPMDINTGVNNDITSEVKTVEARESLDSPPAAEDRAEVVSTADDKSSSVIAAEDNMPGSVESSPAKKRRIKNIIAAYLTSAWVERVEDKHDIVEENISDAKGLGLKVLLGLFSSRIHIFGPIDPKLWI